MNGYNFTDAVRHSLQAAREEAISLDHEYVGTEHMLLGLLSAEDGVAIAALGALGVDLAGLRQTTLAGLKRGKAGTSVGPDLPYTARAKTVLEEAMTAARELRHTYVGTEHLLLGMLREKKGLAAQSLFHHGLTEESVRTEVIRILADATSGQRPTPASRRGSAGSMQSSFLIIIDDPSGQLGAQRFTNVQEAIDFLNRFRGQS